MNSQNLQNKLRDKFLKKGVKMKGPETCLLYTSPSPRDNR